VASLRSSSPQFDDILFHDLKETGDLSEVYFIDGFHKELKGRNGGGDP